MDADVGSSLLLLGEFHRVAEDLDSLLLMTGSTCRGRLTVEAEHLPAPERTQHRQLFTWAGPEHRPTFSQGPDSPAVFQPIWTLLWELGWKLEESLGKFGKVWGCWD